MSLRGPEAICQPEAISQFCEYGKQLTSRPLCNLHKGKFHRYFFWKRPEGKHLVRFSGLWNTVARDFSKHSRFGGSPGQILAVFCVPIHTQNPLFLDFCPSFVLDLGIFCVISINQGTAFPIFIERYHPIFEVSYAS